jgi:polyhydroxyalkanoate synthesis regulator phasin
MTKKIIWRLKESPTTEKLSNLVRDGILTKDEAREILFNLTDESERSIESYQQEIKFLRELIEKLSNRTQIVEVIKEVRHIHDSHPWYTPYHGWTTGAVYLSGTTTDTANSFTLTSDASMAASSDFGDISTF